jgi:hypothetical protein
MYVGDTQLPVRPARATSVERLTCRRRTPAQRSSWISINSSNMSPKPTTRSLHQFVEVGTMSTIEGTHQRWPIVHIVRASFTKGIELELQRGLGSRRST